MRIGGRGSDARAGFVRDGGLVNSGRRNASRGPGQNYFRGRGNSGSRWQERAAAAIQFRDSIRRIVIRAPHAATVMQPGTAATCGQIRVRIVKWHGEQREAERNEQQDGGDAPHGTIVAPSYAM